MPAVDIVKQLAPMPLAKREDTIYTHVMEGNFPDVLRTPLPLTLVRGELDGCISVLPDYLAIGTDDDWIRMPMTPRLAQRVADLIGASLPTRHLVDLIWDQGHRLTPLPMGPPYDASMMSIARFAEHHRMVEAQRRRLPMATDGCLIAGHKKDVVLTPKWTIGHVAIYGWHRAAGPIQPLNAISHDDAYADYSHGIRLVAKSMLVGKESRPYADVLQDPRACPLVSDEGPSSMTRYVFRH